MKEGQGREVQKLSRCTSRQCVTVTVPSRPACAQCWLDTSRLCGTPAAVRVLGVGAERCHRVYKYLTICTSFLVRPHFA